MIGHCLERGDANLLNMKGETQIEMCQLNLGLSPGCSRLPGLTWFCLHGRETAGSLKRLIAPPTTFKPEAPGRSH